MPLSRREFLRASAAAGWLAASGHWHRAARGQAPLPGAPPQSPFLLGDFAPVHEEVTLERLEIAGRLPAGLDGMFVRNGPNPQFPPRGNYHWFDGDGMLHGVRIADGRASYRNRWVRTAGWQEERAAGRALYGGLADPLDFARLAQGGAPFKNAANTALAWHDGRLLALWEGGEPYAVGVPELDTLGPYTFDGALKHPFTAHPKIDPDSGEMMFFGYSPLAPVVHYSVAGADGKLCHAQRIKLRKPVMMHDFAVTKRYSIFLDLPATFAAQPAASGQPGGGGLGIRFDRALGSRFGVLPRHGQAAEIRWFESPACFAFHTLGAYEEADAVVLVACRSDDYPDAVQLGKQAGGGDNPLAGGPQPRLYRWRFDLADGSVAEGPLDDAAVDFPRFDERRLGRPFRFGYCLRLGMDGFVKYDLESGAAVRHELGPGRVAGEGVFVPRPGGQEEDDGWLVSYVYDRANRQSEWIVIEARDFSAPPVARVIIPLRIPLGFHGLWLDGELLG